MFTGSIFIAGMADGGRYCNLDSCGLARAMAPIWRMGGKRVQFFFKALFTPNKILLFCSNLILKIGMNVIIEFPQNLATSKFVHCQQY